MGCAEGLGALEGEVGEFGGAVEAEGDADGADASVDVELHVAEFVEAFDVLLAHGRENEGADVGDADLAAMGVAGEHDVDERKAGVLDDVIDVVGLVTHEDDGRAGIGGDGEVEVWLAGTGVVGAGDPEDVFSAFEGGVAVDEDGCAVCFEGIDDVIGTDGDVVVAEDAEALGSLEGGEDFGGEAGGVPGDGVGTGAAGDEVTGDEDEVGVEIVDLMDHAFEEEGFGELFEVNIAHLDDAEALEAVGEIADGEGLLGDFELVAGVGAGVEGKAEAGGGGTCDEAAARHGAGLRVPDGVRNATHSPL